MGQIAAMMGRIVPALRLGAVMLASFALSSCGGGGGGGGGGGTGVVAPPVSNQVTVIVDGGPTGNSVNTLFTSVTVCVPGSTTECQTIDHVQVDTQSFGLRILSPALSLTLPVTTAADGNSLVECTQFVDGYSWGPVAQADVRIGIEAANSVPVQVIGAANFATVPSSCSSTGARAEDTVAAFGANGILGVGVFEQDCGAGCAGSAGTGFYYSCSTTACAPIAASIMSQVANVIPLFPTDNNGSIIVLPAVDPSGAASVTGSLIFGIDTESDNGSGSVSVLAVQPGTAVTGPQPGNFTIDFNGVPLPNSFIDTGSNGIYFNDTALNTPACSDATLAGHFYCPSSPQNFTATLTGVNGISANASFSVDNAQTLLGNAALSAEPTLAGPYSSATDTFDWGLPFYYGRRVETAIENHSTSLATGPYMAF